MGCPAEGAVWAHPLLISALYFGPKLVLTCFQWFPTPKEPEHRGLKEGECGCLSLVLYRGDGCIAMREAVASSFRSLGTPWHLSSVVLGRRWLGWLFLVPARVLLHSRTGSKY